MLTCRPTDSQPAYFNLISVSHCWFLSRPIGPQWTIRFGEHSDS